LDTCEGKKVLQEGGRASNESVHIGLNVTFSGSQTQWGSEGVPPLLPSALPNLFLSLHVS